MKTEYIKIIENNRDKCTHIRIDFRYDLGGVNVFTYREKQRGYYITVFPVEKGDGVESFTAFTGASDLLQGCARKSAKAEKAALEKYPAYRKMMLDYIAKKYGYTVEGTAE
jgi:CobQ-like glutamine amidotransferase family enzyme